tara:strand:+ start:930 stop:2864 length:1935 start_codon:yes stop_codon:yes gene_type:complete
MAWYDWQYKKESDERKRGRQLADAYYMNKALQSKTAQIKKKREFSDLMEMGARTVGTVAGFIGGAVIGTAVGGPAGTAAGAKTGATIGAAAGNLVGGGIHDIFDRGGEANLDIAGNAAVNYLGYTPMSNYLGGHHMNVVDAHEKQRLAWEDANTKANLRHITKPVQAYQMAGTAADIGIALGGAEKLAEKMGVDYVSKEAAELAAKKAAETAVTEVATTGTGTKTARDLAYTSSLSRNPDGLSLQDFKGDSLLTGEKGGKYGNLNLFPGPGQDTQAIPLTADFQSGFQLNAGDGLSLADTDFQFQSGSAEPLSFFTDKGPSLQNTNLVRDYDFKKNSIDYILNKKRTLDAIDEMKIKPLSNNIAPSWMQNQSNFLDASGVDPKIYGKMDSNTKEAFHNLIEADKSQTWDYNLDRVATNDAVVNQTSIVESQINEKANPYKNFDFSTLNDNADDSPKRSLWANANQAFQEWKNDYTDNADKIVEDLEDTKRYFDADGNLNTLPENITDNMGIQDSYVKTPVANFTESVVRSDGAVITPVIKDGTVANLNQQPSLDTFIQKSGLSKTLGVKYATDTSTKFSNLGYQEVVNTLMDKYFYSAGIPRDADILQNGKWKNIIRSTHPDGVELIKMIELLEETGEVITPSK